METHKHVNYISMPNTGNLDLSEMLPEGLKLSQILSPKAVSFQSTLHKDVSEIRTEIAAETEGIRSGKEKETVKIGESNAANKATESTRKNFYRL